MCIYVYSSACMCIYVYTNIYNEILTLVEGPVSCCTYKLRDREKERERERERERKREREREIYIYIFNNPE